MNNSDQTSIKKGQRLVARGATWATVYEVVRVMPKRGTVTMARIGNEDHETRGAEFPSPNDIGVSRGSWRIADVLALEPYSKPQP